MKSRTFLCFFTPCDEPKFREGYGAQEVISHDTYLRLRYLLIYDVEIGDFNISDITTVTTEMNNDRYRVTTDKRIYDTKDHKYVGGYYSLRYRSIHISQRATYSDETIFKSIAGHELIHSMQQYYYRGMSVPEMEREAYYYSFKTLINGGMLGSALTVQYIAQKHGYWGHGSRFYLP